MVTMIGLINANLMTVEQVDWRDARAGNRDNAYSADCGIQNWQFQYALCGSGVIIFEFFRAPGLEKIRRNQLWHRDRIPGHDLNVRGAWQLVEVALGWKHPGHDGPISAGGVLAGIVVTAIVQSSTAVTSITVAMGMSQVITLEGAVGIILGANIGSCVTGLIASLRLSPARDRPRLPKF